MYSEQGNGRNKRMIRRICLYGVFAALCIVFGYLESLLPFDFIAPGIKLGISNAVALLLIGLNDTKGAFAVNITRILLSALLFGSPFTLLFSLTAGIGSLCVTAFLHHTEKFGTIGISAAGGAVHNLLQIAVAVFVTGRGVLCYLPLLLICGTFTGVLIGFLCSLINKKIKH